MISESELQACQRVAAYLSSTALPYLADIYADRDEETEIKRSNKNSFFIEFYLVFYPSEVKRVNEKLEFGIRQYAKSQMEASTLKKICDEWIKAHTVVWRDGVPHWKSRESK